ncbi:hypothetical protein CCS41_01060 [Candidatus Fukatsuia symbiotica]|uniref:Uncharacterized protein n=1 Tax=Candidatus Fukatsuia symbiotica TaxID=1878942 RepID=A0A2U8I2R4_9GAMM|nr:hypothetical protein CCS41_01060 [Candidatus Fukatsuia symbiotica]
MGISLEEFIVIREAENKRQPWDRFKHGLGLTYESAGRGYPTDEMARNVAFIPRNPKFIPNEFRVTARRQLIGTQECTGST